MSEQTSLTYSSPNDGIKTLAIRIREDVRAQLDVIAQLNDRTVTDEIRFALEAWIKKSKSDPMVLQRADLVRDQIEREATTKRNAISAIFDAKNAAKSTTDTARAGKAARE